jgi:hypothetical protein
MANSGSGSRQRKTTTATFTASSTTGDAIEQRVVAFAEQLGRIVGTVQARTEGWMDREALRKQLASVRDGASHLLDQLEEGVTTLTKTATKTAATVTAPKVASKGRSGGVVDAPGKKHRKPTPADPRTLAADAKRANMRSSQPSMKTTKMRGRG